VIANNATIYNFLGHPDRSELNRLKNKANKGENLTKEEATKLVLLTVSDQISDGLLKKFQEGNPLTADEDKNLRIYLGAYTLQNGEAATKLLLQQGVARTITYPFGGTVEMQLTYAERMSLREWLFGRTKTSDETVFNSARIKAGLFSNTVPNESLTPVALDKSDAYKTLDALFNSPALATSTYLIGMGLGANPKSLETATQAASLLSDIGSSFVLPRAGISPIFGDASAAPSTTRIGIDVVSRLVTEHTQNGQNPLTKLAGDAILNATQPKGTIAVIPEKVKGENQTGNVDLNYVYPNGQMLKTEVKTVANQSSFNGALEDAFNLERNGIPGKGKGADIVAVQVPAGMTTAQARQWIDAFWGSSSGKALASTNFTSGSIAVVSPSGQVLVSPTPFKKP
jgi:hypothetical protein